MEGVHNSEMPDWQLRGDADGINGGCAAFAHELFQQRFNRNAPFARFVRDAGFGFV